MSRSREEREAARLERERRRAAREGTAPPPPPPEPAAPPEPRQSTTAQPQQSDAAPPEPAQHEPQPTEMFDVVATWTDEHPVVAAPPEPEAGPEPAEEPLGTRRVMPHERSQRPGRRPPAPPRTRTPRPPRDGGGHWGRQIAALVAIVLVLVVGWLLFSIYQPGKGEGEGRVAVLVPRGAAVGQIGDLLEARGVIDSASFFRLRAKLSGGAGDLKSGTFTLRRDMSYGAALEALSKNPPPPPVIRVTIPEGKSRGETAPLARQAGLRGDYAAASRSSDQLDPGRYGAPRGASLEGFLFPATYELRRGATAQQLVAQQLAAFRENLAKVDLGFARSKNLTVFDIVTIASMVEREVAVARERPLVAAVIYNRLRQGIALGIDATLRYELNDWDSPLLVSELEADTPYNTRTNLGLPPGPIGNPGLASIEAAAHPARVGYLYYVVKPGSCGEHVFATTDAEAQANVARYNAARDEAGGQSPTTC